MNTEPISPFAALWRSVTKLERGKINTWIALRNAIAVALPLAVGLATHHALGGVAVTTGALNVSYSDGKDPYAHRARRMLAWTLLGAFAVFTGSVTGRYQASAIVVAGAWAFVAGLLVSVSTRAGDLGLNTLVALIVFAARGAMDLKGAATTAVLVLGGGLLQTLLALAFWAFRAHSPERRALGDVYRQLAKEIDPANPEALSPDFQPSTTVEDTLAALGRDHSVEGDRYRMLFDQASRLRMSAFVLQRLQSELMQLQAQHGGEENSTGLAGKVLSVLQLSSTLLAQLGDCLTSDCDSAHAELQGELHSVAEDIRNTCDLEGTPLGRDVINSLEAFAGQLRLVLSLAGHAVSGGETRFDKQESAKPWRLQAASWFGTLRANLDPRSAYCRHAVRLSACVMLGDTIGRMISWQRSYWIPMTIAVVLKPDFTTTFSRGALRLAGTFTGLLLATALYHIVPGSAVSEVILVFLFALALRSIGPANYGVFSTAVSGMIVFLVAATGISPKEVVFERAINTVAGGLFALAAYIAWPTWERKHVSDVLAEMVDAARDYFQAVADQLGQGRSVGDTELDELRSNWRRARSNAEASVDRVSSEPNAELDRVKLLSSMLASSHSMIHSMMGLEALLVQSTLQTPPQAFRTFAADVELTLYYLAAALRGSPAALGTLPQLREDHTRLVRSRSAFSPEDELMLSDTDQLTVSLNTLREQVHRYTSPQVLSQARVSALA